MGRTTIGLVTVCLVCSAAPTFGAATSRRGPTPALTEAGLRVIRRWKSASKPTRAWAVGGLVLFVGIAVAAV